jgi:hypothetical protein
MSPTLTTDTDVIDIDAVCVFADSEAVPSADAVDTSVDICVAPPIADSVGVSTDDVPASIDCGVPDGCASDGTSPADVCSSPTASVEAAAVCGETTDIAAVISMSSVDATAVADISDATGVSLIAPRASAVIEEDAASVRSGMTPSSAVLVAVIDGVEIDALVMLMSDATDVSSIATADDVISERVP